MTACPLGLCDGSGFINLPYGAPEDGREVEDEDNCPHTDYTEPWTPERAKAFLAHYNTAHVFGSEECPWCGPNGLEQRAGLNR
jgi:hypothetical protein